MTVKYNSVTLTVELIVIFSQFLEVWVMFESDNYTVGEDRGPVIVCLTREGEISETLTVQVSTSELAPLQAKGNIAVLS